MIRMTTKNDLPLLKEFLRKKLPSSMSIFSIIEVMERFQIPLKIYVTSSDPTLFIFATHMRTQPPCFCTFWDTQRTTKEDVFQYLKSVPNWNWNEKFFIFRVESTLISDLEKMILEEGLSPQSFEREFMCRCFTFEMSPKALPEVKIPTGFKIGKLKPHHTKLILSKWKYGEGERVSLYEECLKKLPTAAIYREEDKEQENPVSWSMVYNHGAFGMTYTLPEFRRLGLATAVEISLCKELMEEKLVASGDVESDNKQSVDMHKKAGFKIIKEVVYACYFPAKLER